jgi:hypothetical protein
VNISFHAEKVPAGELPHARAAQQKNLKVASG